MQLQIRARFLAAYALIHGRLCERSTNTHDTYTLSSSVAAMMVSRAHLLISPPFVLHPVIVCCWQKGAIICTMLFRRNKNFRHTQITRPLPPKMAEYGILNACKEIDFNFFPTYLQMRLCSVRDTIILFVRILFPFQISFFHYVHVCVLYVFGCARIGNDSNKRNELLPSS